MSKEVNDFIKSSAAVMRSTLELQTRHYQKQREAIEREQYKNIAPIHGISYEGIAYCEAVGISKCFTAYANNCSGEAIESIGFNPNSGSVYIALENGVQIVSNMGQDAEYMTTRIEDGCEHFFDTYEEALNSDFIENSEENY